MRVYCGGKGQGFVGGPVVPPVFLRPIDPRALPSDFLDGEEWTFCRRTGFGRNSDRHLLRHQFQKN